MCPTGRPRRSTRGIGGQATQYEKTMMKMRPDLYEPAKNPRVHLQNVPNDAVENPMAPEVKKPRMSKVCYLSMWSLSDPPAIG